MLLDELKRLCALSGVSGDEGEVRDYIVSRAGRYASDIVTDVMGNVLVYKKGAATPEKSLMLCAHMDEVGVIVTSITDDGYLKFAAAGGIDKRVLVGKAVTFGAKRVLGVIGCKAVHLVKAKDRGKAADIEDLYIDIGAKSREEASSIVLPGDTGAFDGETREFGDGFIKAKAIDDRLGCAVLLKLIESDLPIDCMFAFTVQEEVGMRGAYTAAYRSRPDVALMVEGTTAADMPSVPDGKIVCRTGGGAVIPFMDGGTIYDRELFNCLTGLAESNGIAWQTKNVISGGTDAAAFQRSRAGVRTAGVAAPVRNLHSPSCVGKRSDMEAVYRLASLFIAKMGEMHNA